MTIVATGQASLTDLNDAKHLTAFIGGTQSPRVVYDPTGAGSYTPNYASTNNVLTPELYITGTSGNIANNCKSCKWYYQTNSTGTVTEITANTADYVLTTVSGNLKSLTLKSNLLTANTSMTYICELVYTDTVTNFDITAKSDYQITKLSNGASNFTAVLSNDSHSLATDSAGGGYTLTSATSTMTIYNGSTDDTANWTFSNAVSNCTVTTSGSPSGRTVTLATLTGDVATVTITASRSGYAPLSKVFTVTKNKQGIAGQNPTTYWLTTSNDAIAKNIAGVYTPTNITVTGKAQTGTNAPVTYNGRFVIEESTDGGVTFIAGTKYTSSVDEPTGSKTYPATGTFSANVNAVRVRMHLAGATPSAGNMLDEQMIMVVSDGANSVMSNVWTPDGMHIRNGNGSVRVQCDLFSGANTVTPSAFKWYVQDPTATTSSGGDADGGNGWRLDITPTTPATAPTLNGATAGGTLTGATYYVRYTWVSATGETQASTEASLAVTANYNLKITVPAFPSGVQKACVYVGTATGVANLKYQGDITTSAGTLTITAPISTTTAISPASYTGISGSTTYIITVPASAIIGTEGFKCVCTYNGVKYSGATSVSDISDPIQVVISGVTQFKNGQGNTTLTALLYQAGSEIDQAGNSGYTYTWALYNASGVKNNTAFGGSGTFVGKTLTVQATDVSGRGNLVCTVSK